MRAQRIVRTVTTDGRGFIASTREVKLDDDGNRVQVEREIARGPNDEIVEIVETISPYIPTAEERSAARIRGLQLAQEQYWASQRSRPDSYLPPNNLAKSESRRWGP